MLYATFYNVAMKIKQSCQFMHAANLIKMFFSQMLHAKISMGSQSVTCIDKRLIIQHYSLSCSLFDQFYANGQLKFT